MDTGDRGKKNIAKGGARPKESSKKSQNFQPNRVFKSPESDSSDYLDAASKLKDSFTSISSGLVEGYRSTLHKANRKKRRARSNCDNTNQNRQTKPKFRKEFSGEDYSILKEHHRDHEISSKIHDDTNGLSRCMEGASSLSEFHSDKDKTLKYFTNPENITQWNPCSTSDNSSHEKGSMVDSSDYWSIAKDCFLNKNVKSRFTLRRSSDYTEPNTNQNDKRPKKFRKNKKSIRSNQQYDVDIDEVIVDHYNSWNSIANKDILSTDEDDASGAWKACKLLKQHNSSKESRKSLRNLCQFSSSSSEADDEFECDCSFCFNNENNSRPAGIDLVRSMLNERAEINNQLFGDWLDAPSLSPTESTWDALVQELVDQIRHFNMDIDFSQCSVMTNSDFESLPTVVPSDSGQYSHQETQTCTICLSNYEANEMAKVLPCLHIFHVQCIKLWLAKSSTCPVCRDIVTKKT